MHRVLLEDIPYTSMLVREISNKFWLIDLVLYLFFSPVRVTPVNVLASSLPSSLYINRQFCRETINLSYLHSLYRDLHQNVYDFQEMSF